MVESAILSVLTQLAEKYGVNVINYDFSPSINGLFYRYEQGSYIGLNKSLSGEKLNWVFAHELGHYQLHREEENLILYSDRRKMTKLEKQAEAFAAMLIDAIKLALLEARDNVRNHHDLDPPPANSAVGLAA